MVASMFIHRKMVQKFSMSLSDSTIFLTSFISLETFLKRKMLRCIIINKSSAIVSPLEIAMQCKD